MTTNHTTEQREIPNAIGILAEELVEDRWQDESLWPGLEDDAEGRPVGKNIEQAYKNLTAALQSAYEDWLEGENNEA